MGAPESIGDYDRARAVPAGAGVLFTLGAFAFETREIHWIRQVQSRCRRLDHGKDFNDCISVLTAKPEK